MKILLRFDLDEETRRAIAHTRGRKRPATREECRLALVGELEAFLQTVVSEYDMADDSDKTEDDNE